MLYTIRRGDNSVKVENVDTMKTKLPALMLGLLLIFAPHTAAQNNPSNLESQLKNHVHALSVDIGARPAGSEAETQAADYIAAQFSAWGYDVTVQEFEITGTENLTSRNVIATGGDPNGPRIITGAHMDSVASGTGADDNASGVAVMLAAAETLAGLETGYALTFIAFGAEEIGTHGSYHYVNELDDDALANIYLMANVDTVGSGDNFYVYAAATESDAACNAPFATGPTWPRDLALELGEALGHDVQTSPPHAWDGFTGPWSDHFPFAQHDVPTIYFERWNWDAGNNPCWGQETATQDILHTKRDVFEAVEIDKMLPVAETLIALLETVAE